MNRKEYQKLWIEPPEPGDLVEIGYDSISGKPFIGVVTEIRQKTNFDTVSQLGCVLANGKSQWCDLYKLRPVKIQRRKHYEDES